MTAKPIPAAVVGSISMEDGGEGHRYNICLFVKGQMMIDEVMNDNVSRNL